jgi:protein-L-isoaspartate(D-aspartate) O-methyltransferase
MNGVHVVGGSNPLAPTSLLRNAMEPDNQDSSFDSLRERMINQQLIPGGIVSSGVLKAMGKIPRHLFVPEDQVHNAYNDYPLPIGHGQTISQPFMVALMTQCLNPADSDNILEVGTGSGYQTAILAELSKRVYSIERIFELAEGAKIRLSKLGYTNVTIKVSDGTLGWPEYAPFDGIMVTAGAPEIPVPLVEQLTIGGRIVIPIGTRYSQSLKVAIRTRGGVRLEDHGGCVFVKLIGEYGWA